MTYIWSVHRCSHKCIFLKETFNAIYSTNNFLSDIVDFSAPMFFKNCSCCFSVWSVDHSMSWSHRCNSVVTNIVLLMGYQSFLRYYFKEQTIVYIFCNIQLKENHHDVSVEKFQVRKFVLYQIIASQRSNLNKFGIRPQDRIRAELFHSSKVKDTSLCIYDLLECGNR
jgi:hypothetical protein